MNNRYKELKQENTNKANQLTTQYQRIANIYVSKARGYAVKSIDTEARIKDVLDELQDYDERGVNITIVIPNITEYVETKIKLLAKQTVNTNKIKTIIFSCIFLLIIGGFIGLGLWFRSGNYLDKPENLSVTKQSENELVFIWDDVENANLGYTVWYDDTNKISITDNIYVFNLDSSKEYTFHVYANDVTSGEGENKLYLYYGSETSSYEYKPNK